MLYQIYLVTNKINNKQYVGQTKQSIGYIERFKRHCNNKTNDLFHNALKKYGSDNFEVNLLENNVAEEIVDEREKYWIKKLKTYYLDDTTNNKGYNMTLGGQGTHGHILTPKVKEKISLKVKQAQNKLKQEDPEKYYKWKSCQKNIKRTDQTKALISKKVLLSYKLGRVNPFLNKKHTSLTKRKIATANGKKVGMFNLNNELLKEFISAHEAAEYLIENNITKNKNCYTRILNLCYKDQGIIKVNGLGKTGYGYIWKFL